MKFEQGLDAFFLVAAKGTLQHLMIKHPYRDIAFPSRNAELVDSFK